jgi:hypothetical protein
MIKLEPMRVRTLQIFVAMLLATSGCTMQGPAPSSGVESAIPTSPQRPTLDPRLQATVPRENRLTAAENTFRGRVAGRPYMATVHYVARDGDDIVARWESPSKDPAYQVAEPVELCHALGQVGIRRAGHIRFEYEGGGRRRAGSIDGAIYAQWLVDGNDGILLEGIVYDSVDAAAELSHPPEPAQRSSVDPGTAVAPAR